MKKTLEALAVLLLATAGIGAVDSAAPSARAGDFMALNPEILRFLEEHVSTGRDRNSRLHELMDAVFGRSGLDIKYGNSRTKTAIETFETRSGNCLSFTVMFVAMARQVGLNAGFVEVGELLSWERRGDLLVSNQHMYAEVDINNVLMPVDFLPGSDKRYRLVRRINDERAHAHFYNNLGVEKLTAGEPEVALTYFESALEADPTFSHALTSIGVAYRRLGDLAAAEDAYLKAISLDRNQSTPLSNLASLYLASGRYKEGEAYLRRAGSLRRKSPFHNYRLGVESAKRGDFGSAIRHLKIAVRRLPGDVEFRAALAEVYERAGQTERAEACLKKALRISESGEERMRLEEKLESLRARPS